MWSTDTHAGNYFLTTTLDGWYVRNNIGNYPLAFIYVCTHMYLCTHKHTNTKADSWVLHTKIWLKKCGMRIQELDFLLSQHRFCWWRGYTLETTLENAGSLCFRWGLIHRQMSPMTTGHSISVLTSANSPSLWALRMVQCFSGSIWFPFYSPALWAGDKNHVNLSQQSCCFPTVSLVLGWLWHGPELILDLVSVEDLLESARDSDWN